MLRDNFEASINKKKEILFMMWADVYSIYVIYWLTYKTLRRILVE